MKVLIYIHTLPPIVGGAEKYVMLLAQGLSVLVDSDVVEITVKTPTPAGDFNDSKVPFCVVRQPNLRALASLSRKAEVIQLVGPCLFLCCTDGSSESPWLSSITAIRRFARTGCSFMSRQRQLARKQSPNV